MVDTLIDRYFNDRFNDISLKVIGCMVLELQVIKLKENVRKITFPLVFNGK